MAISRRKRINIFKKFGLDDVALWVSLDLTGSEDYAETLKPTVTAVLEELETEVGSGCCQMLTC